MILVYKRSASGRLAATIPTVKKRRRCAELASGGSATSARLAPRSEWVMLSTAGNVSGEGAATKDEAGPYI